jgi:hypothetical protein
LLSEVTMLRLAKSARLTIKRDFYSRTEKTVILGLVFVLLIFISSSNNYYTYAADQTNAKVEILGLHTDPALVRVNDTFAINAVVLNNSTSAKVTLEFLGCGGSPLSAVFDKNVKIDNRSCNIVTIGRIIELLPQQSVNVHAPDYLHTYRALKAGNTTATVTLQYGIENNNNNNNTFSSVQHSSTSKPFVFPIIKRFVPTPCPIPDRPCL